MSVHLHAVNDNEVLADLDRRMCGYGNGKRLAEEFGVHPTYLRSAKSGNQPVTAKIAAALGWELRWARKHENIPDET